MNRGKLSYREASPIKHTPTQASIAWTQKCENNRIDQSFKKQKLRFSSKKYWYLIVPQIDARGLTIASQVIKILVSIPNIQS